VKVTLGDSQLTAYSSGALWSSDVAATDGTGLVLLGNVPALAFPGSNKRIVLSGAASGFIDVRVIADGVSLVGVPL
jgi:hypothetical protein